MSWTDNLPAVGSVANLLNDALLEVDKDYIQLTKRNKTCAG
jgi:hypothetical protein